MASILLVEPAYRSKFPPIGLLRIGAYHMEKGDAVTFVRGKVPDRREQHWHRVYVSSLFTYELSRTVSTAKYYASSVDSSDDLFVGGIGATLNPDYIRERLACRLVLGRLDQGGELDPQERAVSDFTPAMSLLESVEYHYAPDDAYFCRATVGCIRRCEFCAVPVLEPVFDYERSLSVQIAEVDAKYGPRQDLVLLDNNVLAVKDFDRIVDEIVDCGFARGSKVGRRMRKVDFNQGIDARLIDKHKAEQLGRIGLSPIRLAFDTDEMESSYSRAIELLADQGFTHFTNYVLFNFDDTPESLYNRLARNYELNSRHGVNITAFPMKYVPVHDVDRKHIGPAWNWRLLRGIQCVLTATHGMVSPNPDFFEAAFGADFESFKRILMMPDDYIIHRKDHAANGAADWAALFSSLDESQVDSLGGLLHRIHMIGPEAVGREELDEFGPLLEHHFPGIADSLAQARSPLKGI